jgi:hypothetical protein
MIHSNLCPNIPKRKTEHDVDESTAKRIQTGPLRERYTMEHGRYFTSVSIDAIQAYVAKNETPFETSELYSQQQHAKILDLDQRKSIFRSFLLPFHRAAST